MSFPENLQFLRDRAGMTQEGLAERLEVTRQSVSKWESGGSYPEMEKLLQMCDLFAVDLDTLLRGDVADSFHEEATAYDAHMNWFSRIISGGVGLILLGLAVMSLLWGLGMAEEVATAIFLTFVAAAVVMFIVAGITHDSFEKRHPVMADPYTPKQREDFDRRFPIYIAVPVAGILIAVAWMILLGGWAERTGERAESLVGALFFLALTVCITTLIWAGMQKSKYDLKEWNREHDPSPEAVHRRNRVGKVCGIIMLLATAVYLAVGFGFMAFSGDRYSSSGLGFAWGWIVYPVAGVLCGVVSILIGPGEEE